MSNPATDAQADATHPSYTSGSRDDPARSAPPSSGELFPDIWADSTHGPLQLHRWSEGRFTVIFAHASAYDPVAERDIMAMARAQCAFDALRCRVIGLTQSDPMTERVWLEDLSERHGVDVAFPVLSDEHGQILQTLGMMTDSSGDGAPVAKTFVIDPIFRVRAILEYPQSVGRDPNEVLRIVSALSNAFPS